MRKEPLTIETEREKYLLYALASMCDQYLSYEIEGRTILDHVYMIAGQVAFEALYAYGLIDRNDRRAKWTVAGRQLVDSSLYKADFPR